MGLVIYYLVLPFLAAWLVLKFLKRHAAHALPDDIRALLARSPIEKRFFRALRRDHKGLHALGDFEKQAEAVEAIYRGREEAQAKGDKAAFLVANDKGETLEEIDC